MSDALTVLQGDALVMLRTLPDASINLLDPFAGSGTTGMVALEFGRKAVLIELNPEYIRLIEQRCDVTQGLPL